MTDLGEGGTHGRLDRLVTGCPIYYGWVILVVGTFGVAMTGPGQTYIVSMFIEHFIRDLGLSRSVVSTLYMIGTLSNAILLQLIGVGRIIDRRGPRFVALLCALLLGGTCIYMGFVSSAVMLAIGFIGLRFFGQGSLTLSSSTMMNQWWVRRRGTVRGLSGTAFSGIVSVLPGITMALIGAVGWRPAYVVWGGALIALMAPVAWLFYRRRPEDHGLVPDGGTVRTRRSKAAVDAEVDLTLSQALRTPLFWALSFGIASMSMLGTGLIFHMESIVTDQGLAASVAAAVFVPMGLVQAILRFPLGILADLIAPKLVLAGALVLQGVTLWMAPRLSSQLGALVYGGVFGAMQVAWSAAGSVMWAKYYGRLHLGSITGAAISIGIVGSSLGPMAMGFARDLMGTYATFFNLSAFIPLALAVVVVIVRTPRGVSSDTTATKEA